MMNVFVCLSFILVISIFLQSNPAKCNELNISEKGKMLYDYFFTPKVRGPKDGGTDQDVHTGDKHLSYTTSEAQIRHHEQVHIGGMKNNDHKKELKEHMDQLKMLHKSLKDKDKNAHDPELKVSGGESVHNTDGTLGDTHANGEETSDDSLAKYVQEEIRKNEKLNNEKKSYDEINILEDNSKKLQNDIHTWLQSVKNISEKTNKLKDIKTQLLNNIASLNETLTEEIENIKEIKKLQMEQNQIFSENWLYFLPSTFDNLASHGQDGNFQVLNYLEKFNRRDGLHVSGEKANLEQPSGTLANEGNVRKQNAHTDGGVKSSDFHSFCNVIVLLAVVTFLLS